MCQANPFPAAIIWGALRIVFDCADRFASLFETIKQQLQDLTFHIERINYFDKLYKDPSMQTLLCRSYITVLRFWARVRKECERNTFNMFLKSAAPFSTKKMDSIILDLKRDAEEIKDRADMLEKVHLFDRVKEWLSVRGTFQDILEANHRRHDSNRANHIPGTSEWIFQTTEFQEWTAETSKFPILWMSGDPGAGKSMLCSRAIQYVQDTDPSAATAFHFFRFDQENSAIDLLRVMAGQVLENVRQSTKDVPDSVLRATEALNASVRNVMSMMSAITSCSVLPRTYLFIDGLDEELAEQRWSIAQETLQSLISLVTYNPKKSVRLWLSSQAHNAIMKKMDPYPRIHLTNQNEADIRLLFEKGIQELDDIDTTSEEKELWFELLKGKAKGNFLWAYYMIHSLSEEAESIADMESLINDSLPNDINEYYRRQFKRIPTSYRDLAAKIFSIVCFSRRPVSVSELSDAIGLIRNPNPSSKSDLDRRKPRLKLIQNLLSPMIVEETGPHGVEKRCRLFHLTVKEFVKKNPRILGEGEEDAENVSIDPSILGELCLQYLSQPRYSNLLEKVGGEWKTADGESPEKDVFLRYTAKYWYYHLDEVSPSKDLTEKISTFLKSPNFQTLLQLQYLYVDRADNFMSHMRSRYSSFALSTGDQDGIRTTTHCYEGYSACGKAVYLVQFVSRNAQTLHFVCETWRLDEFGKPRLQRRQKLEVDEESANSKLYFDNDDANLNVRLVRAKPIAFDYDARSLRIGSQLHMRDEFGGFHKLNVDENPKDRFPPYFEEFLTQGKHVIVTSRRSAPVPGEGMLDANDPVQDVNKLFDESWENKKENDFEDSDLPYIDDSSSESSASEESASSSSAATGVDWSSGDETWSEASTEVDEAINDENAIVIFRGYIDSSGTESTEYSPSEPESEEEDPETGGLGMTPGSRFLRGFMDDESDGDDAYILFDESDEYDSDAGGELHLRSRYGKARLRKGNKKGGLEASLRVFSISETGLKCIFRLSRELDLMLYDSPPALHPFEPFVIWPMSPGNVLFADFSQKTWFKRKLRPTTTYTRQVFTKCHFSKCGKYLHIAILEARQKPSKKSTKTPKTKRKDSSTSSKSESSPPPLELALFVTTHRLSSRKTTRAPPTQIHRTKIDLGSFESLPVSRLPFSLTWTPSELYFTQSSTELTVFRIKLFAPGPGEEPVLVPREKIFLPKTAEIREVRFFRSEPESASSDGHGAMRVLMGSETRCSRVLLGEPSPHGNEGGFQSTGAAWVPHSEALKGVEGRVSLPAGFCLASDEDFGGWVRSDDIADVPPDRGIGQLDLKVERFDVEEDCDVEPYII
ncbi:hypothetical protein ARAM_001867 [Aspergillus rambellii]|uniref:Uncharacterized protein n=1 Tax=Aspergillus rambellii TaxID=308745 RepID=A0A0F8WP03_9EURO|nr:hypothetical protein ARAM_001867 [Aspergillus rambellii]